MRSAFLFFSLVIFIGGYAQLIYPVVGTYKGKGAQGMAIYGDSALLMSDGGGYRLLDLSSGRIVRDGVLASAGKNTHVNCACFSSEKVNGSFYPLLYITEFRDPSRCFVEQIGEDGRNKLVQTISAMKNGTKGLVRVWVVDNENRKLYGITRGKMHLDAFGSVKNTILKFRLPDISEGKNVILTEKDVESQFEVIFPNALQGGKIRKGKLYISTGYSESSRESTEYPRALLVVDLKKQKLIKKTDLTYVTTNEPEDIDFYKGRCLLYCGQTGGIYRIKH